MRFNGFKIAMIDLMMSPTFNSIYADLNGNLYDPFDGKKHLQIG